MDARKALLSWIDKFENDHYEYDVYGEMVKVDLPRESVEKLIDISILLVDRVVAAKGELSTAEYEGLEEDIRKKYPNDEAWLQHVALNAVTNDRLFGRYRDIERMIGELSPRGYPADSVDDVKENYNSLVYTFFLGVMAKGWGEGYGWSKTAEGNWHWSSRD